MEELEQTNITGTFIIVRNGKWEKYENYDEIPESFDTLVSCVPNPLIEGESWADNKETFVQIMPLIVEDLKSREVKPNDLLIDTIEVPKEIS
jgi:hypothetical protein